MVLYLKSVRISYKNNYKKKVIKFTRYMTLEMTVVRYLET